MWGLLFRFIDDRFADGPIYIGGARAHPTVRLSQGRLLQPLAGPDKAMIEPIQPAKLTSYNTGIKGCEL